MTRRPKTVLVLAALSLGMLTTVAVAWGIAWRTGLHRYSEEVLVVPRPTDASSPVLELRVYRCQSWGSLWITALALAEPREVEAFELATCGMDQHVRPFSPAEVYGLLADPGAWPTNIGGKARQVAGVRAHGWPLPALWHRTVYDGRSGPWGYADRGAVLIGALHARAYEWQMGPLYLPYLPLWRNLLADTALYGAAWALLLLAWAGVRTATRRRRGLCPVCAYDLSGLPPASPCPECGRARPTAGGPIPSGA